MDKSKKEKIQLRLEVMTVWADLAETVDSKAKDALESMAIYQENLKDEEAKPEEERREWRTNELLDTINRYRIKRNAYDEVLDQIYKAMS